MASTLRDAGIDLPTPNMVAEKEGGIGWMTFNNPERRNAISFEMRLAIIMILDDFEADDAIRVIVMKGAGRAAFVSGSDISQFATHRATPEQRETYDAMSATVAERFASVRKPLIAMIGGFCLGAGLGTALNADLRVAAEGSQFGIPAARLGLGYGFGNTKKLTDVVGPANAKDILFTARRLTAAEALAMGLVNRVVPVAELEDTVRALAIQIAGNAPLTLHAAKIIIGETQKPESQRDPALCEQLVEACMSSEDYQEGRAAFMEKRKPEFQGK